MRKILSVFFLCVFGMILFASAPGFKAEAADRSPAPVQLAAASCSMELGLDDLQDFNLPDFSLPDAYDFADKLLDEFAGTGLTLALFLAFLFSLLWCLCGYRVFHVFTGITAFLISNLLGVIFAFAKNDTGNMLFFFLLSIVLLVLCIIFKSFAAFILGSVNTMPIWAIVSLLIVKNVNNSWLLLTLIFSVALGIVTAIFKKPIIIICTALEWGAAAGNVLAALIHHTRYGSWLGILFIAAGLFCQIYHHGGLLEGSEKRPKKKPTPAAAPVPDGGFSGVTYPDPPAVYPSAGYPDVASRPTEPYVDSSIPEPSTASSGGAETDMKICKNCGTKLKNDTVFCISCGVPVTAAPLSAHRTVFADSATGMIPETPPVPPPPVSTPAPDYAADPDGAFVFCKNCGSQQKANTVFCTSCGIPMDAGSTPPPPPVPASAPVPSGGEKMVFCRKCGSKQKKEMAFCTSCGAELRVRPAEFTGAAAMPPEHPAASHAAADAHPGEKLKFGSFTRAPEVAKTPVTPGELVISLAEGRPESRTNSSMKPADDFDDE